MTSKLCPASAPDPIVRVARAVRHPDYERETHAHDVALLRLAVAVEVPPLRLPDPGEDVPTPGGAARVVGFGDTRDGDAPPGVRRQGGVRVTEVRPNVPCPDPDATTNNPEDFGVTPPLALQIHDDCSEGAFWTQPTDYERLTLQTSQGYNRNWGELVVIADPVD